VPQYCHCCNCTGEKLTSWTHPQNNKELQFCSFCMRTIIGVCSHCDEVVYNLEQYSIDENDKMLCSECSYVQYLSEEGVL
jgi:hypothetical protein